MPNGALNASVLLPQGRKGPAFLALPNFKVYFEWNKSFVYVTTAAYFATRIAGAPRFIKGNPDPSLSDAQMRSLQKKLAARGYDVGKIDGILGAKTRAAVQSEQNRLGMPADAWPTKTLLANIASLTNHPLSLSQINTHQLTYTQLGHRHAKQAVHSAHGYGVVCND